MKGRWEKDLSRWLDGELPPHRAEAVTAKLAAEPEMRAQVEQWKEIGARLREAPLPPLQTPEAGWADVRRALRQSAADPGGAPAWFGGRLAWAGSLLGLALLFGFSFLLLRGDPSLRTAAADAGGAAVVYAHAVEVEWVDIDRPDSTSMIFQDSETGLTVVWMVELNEKEAFDADS